VNWPPLVAASARAHIAGTASGLFVRITPRGAGIDGLFSDRGDPITLVKTPKIVPSMPIVSETERLANWRNSPLNSKAQISDGSGRRFFVVRRKIRSARSTRYHNLE
jgi:hypothetical protein